MNKVTEWLQDNKYCLFIVFAIVLVLDILSRLISWVF